MKGWLFLIMSILGFQKIQATKIVHDPTNFARQAEILRQATEQVNKATEQIQKLNDQLQQMKAQYQQTKKLYEAVTGNKNFGEIYHNPVLQQTLPQEWHGLYQATQRNKATLQRLINTVKGEEEFTGPIEDMQKYIENRTKQVAIINKALGLQAYEGSQARMKQVENLMGEIKHAHDSKSIAELQARIAIEQAFIQNEITQLQMISQLQHAEQQLIDQKKYEMSRRILNPQNKGMPHIRKH